MYIYKCIYIVGMSTDIGKRIHIYIYVHACMNMYVYIYKCVCAYAHTRVYPCTYVHELYICTHT